MVETATESVGIVVHLLLFLFLAGDSFKGWYSKGMRRSNCLVWPSLGGPKSSDFQKQWKVPVAEDLHVTLRLDQAVFQSTSLRTSNQLLLKKIHVRVANNALVLFELMLLGLKLFIFHFENLFLLQMELNFSSKLSTHTQNHQNQTENLCPFQPNTNHPVPSVGRLLSSLKTPVSNQQSEEAAAELLDIAFKLDRVVIGVLKLVVQDVVVAVLSGNVLSQDFVIVFHPSLLYLKGYLFSLKDELLLLQDFVLFLEGSLLVLQGYILPLQDSILLLQISLYLQEVVNIVPVGLLVSHLFVFKILTVLQPQHRLVFLSHLLLVKLATERAALQGLVHEGTLELGLGRR
ncbi:hypothetical protein PG990_009052 [Apiospora arundinis]